MANDAHLRARVPQDLKTRLDAAAKADGRTSGDMLRRLLERALRDHKAA